MNIEEIIEESEFQEDKNGAIERFLLENNVTSTQRSHLIDFMDYINDKIRNREEVSKEFFEDEIFCIVPEKRGDDNFCKLLAGCWRDEYQISKVSEYFYGI